MQTRAGIKEWIIGYGSVTVDAVTLGSFNFMS